MRDLTSLLALPALWSGRDAATVTATLCEALETILPADVIYLKQSGGEGLGTLRVRGAPAGDDGVSWQPFLRSLEGHDGGLETCLSPIGPLKVARAQIALSEPRLTLWIGSGAPDFPRAEQLAYVGAAVSLASSGLRTARLIAEREFASRMKDEFLAMLGHELRNPLAAIATALEVLSLKNLPGAQPEQRMMMRQVGQLGRLVDDLVDVARVAKGKIDLRLEPVSLETAVEGALESVRQLVAEKGHRLSVDVKQGLAVQGDPVRLQQIFANLLSNAAKYTDRGGHVEVRARVEEGRACIRVRDNGSGIEPELLEHIFEPFTQGRRSPDRAAGGLGIGLALVRSLVELHGGQVCGESGGSGRGSAFTVRLPLAASSPAPLRPALSRPPAVSGQLRLLVVDDNVDGAEALAGLLRLHGHEVRVAHDGLEAVDVLQRFPADTALIDIGLPGMDGRALARRLRERMGSRAPRMIALSGYGQAEDRAQSLAAGMALHLVKPVDIEALLGALRPGDGGYAI